MGRIPAQFETLAEHNCSTRQEKSTYLITALQGRATDVLHGVPKGATFEKTLEDLENHFEDQHPSRPEAHERIPLAYW
jgi:hypothetical protein